MTSRCLTQSTWGKFSTTPKGLKEESWLQRQDQGQTSDLLSTGRRSL